MDKKNLFPQADDSPLAWRLQTGRYELSNESVLDLLRRAKVGTLAIMLDEWPLLIPLPFVFRAGEIFAYCHDSLCSKDMIRQDPNLCFSVLGVSSYSAPLAPCPSVSVFGKFLPTSGLDITIVHELFRDKYAASAFATVLSDESSLLRIAGYRICGNDLLPE